MPTQAQLDELRARFEASRSFEDDDEWFPSTSSANSSRSSTLTTVKKQPPKNLTVKKLAAAAIKRKSVDLEASKRKWEPTAHWEPPSYQERAFTPREVENYAGGMTEAVEPSTVWMEGWYFDEYGRPVKVENGGVKERLEPLEVLRKGMLARSGNVPR